MLTRRQWESLVDQMAAMVVDRWQRDTDEPIFVDYGDGRDVYTPEAQDIFDQAHEASEEIMVEVLGKPSWHEPEGEQHGPKAQDQGQGQDQGQAKEDKAPAPGSGAPGQDPESFRRVHP